MINYLVTTRLERLQQVTTPIIMVDGTVPGWKPIKHDSHFDHHRPNGKDIQVDEIPVGYPFPKDVTLVTTMVDADACVAAAWLVLGQHPRFDKDAIRKLRAIAYDCDHLAVPKSLEDLSNFALEAVAALKLQSEQLIEVLELPKDRKLWAIDQKEAFTSKAFEIGSNWLVDAVKGIRPWPGVKGEAEEYWQQIIVNTRRIIDEKRISVYRNCLLFDGRGMAGTYIDPRCWLRAVEILELRPVNPITLIQREVFSKDKFLGFSYTLGTLPFHPGTKMLDYTHCVFEDLSKLEKKNSLNSGKWGGRKTLGGSDWNIPSSLSPAEIIDCILDD